MEEVRLQGAMGDARESLKKALGLAESIDQRTAFLRFSEQLSAVVAAKATGVVAFVTGARNKGAKERVLAFCGEYERNMSCAQDAREHVVVQALLDRCRSEGKKEDVQQVREKACGMVASLNKRLMVPLDRLVQALRLCVARAVTDQPVAEEIRRWKVRDSALMILSQERVDINKRLLFVARVPHSPVSPWATREQYERTLGLIPGVDGTPPDMASPLESIDFDVVLDACAAFLWSHAVSDALGYS
jgi:hypothetical protein